MKYKLLALDQVIATKQRKFKRGPSSDVLN